MKASWVPRFGEAKRVRPGFHQISRRHRPYLEGGKRAKTIGFDRMTQGVVSPERDVESGGVGLEESGNKGRIHFVGIDRGERS